MSERFRQTCSGSDCGIRKPLVRLGCTCREVGWCPTVAIGLRYWGFTGHIKGDMTLEASGRDRL